MAKFERVSCSQCGQDFGPRDSGYSHCEDHVRDATTRNAIFDKEIIRDIGLGERQEANAVWGANCGPMALAFVLGIPMSEVRGLVERVGFAEKRCMNPTMMRAVLRASGRGFEMPEVPSVRPGQSQDLRAMWSRRPAVVRIQWEGPWTVLGSNAKWAYRHTHYVATWQHRGRESMVFDGNSGVLFAEEWNQRVVPEIMGTIPKASGYWHYTHAWRLV